MKMVKGCNYNIGGGEEDQNDEQDDDLWLILPSGQIIVYNIGETLFGRKYNPWALRLTVSKAADLNNQPMQATGQFSFPEAPCLCCAAPAVWLSQHQRLIPGQRQTVNPLSQNLRRN